MMLLVFLIVSPISLWVISIEGANPLGVLLTAHLPVWAAWRVAIGRAAADPEGRIFWAASTWLGGVVLLISVAAAVLAVRYLLVEGFAFGGGDAIESARTGRQARGLFLLWILPTLLVVINGLAVLAAAFQLAKVRRTSRMVRTLR